MTSLKFSKRIQKLPDFGYELRTEEVEVGDEHEVVEIVSAYNLRGDYIGNPRTAYYLCWVKQISPEKISPDDNVCSIGFSKKEQKWYGWSHRAIWGFGIGDMIKEGDCASQTGWTQEYLEQHPEADRSLPVGFKIKTLNDARRAAIAFADSVS